jgi:orotidine-5'-phosphate decarboxylase
MIERPIIALDFPSKKEIELFLQQFPESEKLFVKVGMEIFYQEGPSIVTWLKEQGHDIFLDLKLHDIPHTVERAMSRLANLGVAITNVHAAGGIEMMAAAKRGLRKGTKEGQAIPQLIAVTQLTSTSEEQMQQEQLITTSLAESVRHYAQCAQKAGLDGVVCSAHEAAAIKKATHADFMCLTPGIRPAGSDAGDQKRIVTPAKAKQIGSSVIVVGRPITQSATPFETYQEIKQAWKEAVQ